MSIMTVALAAFIVFALAMFTMYRWMRDATPQPKPPACPCGCARVGAFCAKCGRPKEPPAVYLHEHSMEVPVYRSGSFDPSALWPHKSAAKTWHTSSSTFINMQWKLPRD